MLYSTVHSMSESAKPFSKSLNDPDERIELPGITENIVDIGGFTVGKTIQEPGWRWSTHAKPRVGGESCQAHHLGIVISGRLGVDCDDGSHHEFGPDEVYEIPPGHDGHTASDEPVVLFEFSGLRSFAGKLAGHHGRFLATVLLTDVVESTATAVQMGDVAWRELLTRHYAMIRAELEQF